MDSSSQPTAPYTIEYTDEAWGHLIALRAFERPTVTDAVDAQLEWQPTAPTRNRKPMRPNPLSAWELRIGDLRVYYDALEVDRKVVIVAIGRKHGSRVTIGGEEVDL